MSHTPGPWEVERRWSNGCEICPIIASKSKWIADVVGAPHLGFSDTIDNARLIAAAPDLVEACEAIIARGADDYSGMKAVRAAVAKAKGTA